MISIWDPQVEAQFVFQSQQFKVNFRRAFLEPSDKKKEAALQIVTNNSAIVCNLKAISRLLCKRAGNSI